jgi:hypothetical protein
MRNRKVYDGQGEKEKSERRWGKKKRKRISLAALGMTIGKGPVDGIVS